MTPDVPDWMEPEWTVLREGRVTALVRRDFAAPFREAGLARAADVAPAELGPDARGFHPSGGRTGMAAVPAGPLGEAVVRPYRRGGLPGRFIEARYFLGDRARREAVVTERLRRAGVPAVEPLAAVRSDRALGYRAALVTRLVPGAAPAPELLAEGAGQELRELLRRMGRSAGLLHRAGGVHADLNAHNFLLPRDASAPALLLDFDRTTVLRGPTPRPFAHMNLRRLRRSLRKLGLKSALDAWDAFREGYAADGGEAEGDGAVEG